MVMVTHEAREEGMQNALREINALRVTLGETQLIRIEDPAIKDEGL